MNGKEADTAQYPGAGHTAALYAPALVAPST